MGGAPCSWRRPRRGRRHEHDLGRAHQWARRHAQGGVPEGGAGMREVRPEALLVLADGEVYEGEAVGAEPPGGVASGEVVFNTVLTGYQEVLTDPSYAGQIISFTYPHIGNYGVTA